MTEMVSVSKELLLLVLDTAESNSFSTEAEFCCSEEGHERYKRDRLRIRELRTMAGIESE